MPPNKSSAAPIAIPIGPNLSVTDLIPDLIAAACSPPFGPPIFPIAPNAWEAIFIPVEPIKFPKPLVSFVKFNDDAELLIFGISCWIVVEDFFMKLDWGMLGIRFLFTLLSISTSIIPATSPPVINLFIFLYLYISLSHYCM